MVTQQILVLFFLVRIQVAQLFLLLLFCLLGYGVMVTQQILVLFFLVRIQVAQQRRSLRRSFFVSIRFSVRISEIISLSVIENSFVDNQKLSRQ